MAAVLAVMAALGAFHLVTATVFRWPGLGLSPRTRRRPTGRRAQEWLAQAGLSDVPLRRVLLLAAGAAVAAAALAFLFFGGVTAPVALGAFAAVLPAATLRRRRAVRRSVAQEAWPRLIEEIRILTGAAGRSIPQALFEAGRRAPAELRPAFAAAHREWLLSTDFARTLDVLKHQLADPTADVACETLLVAFDVGGTDLDRRLEALAEDRRADSQDRKDARARQAGARFARMFVLIVPLGMALAGLSIGNGRAAYESTGGQAAVLVALLLMAGCWWWAGRLMRLPDEQRVFPA